MIPTNRNVPDLGYNQAGANGSHTERSGDFLTDRRDHPLAVVIALPIAGGQERSAGQAAAAASIRDASLVG
jgi:hypothetical protein